MAIPLVIALVGPTGVGKSELAIAMAQKFNGEIINCDSRQIYRHMDIGTAKPSAAQREMVPHHLFNIIDPDEPFSLAQYQELATVSIRDIHARNRLPFLVGGSGQYLWAIVEGWIIPKVPPDKVYRDTLEKAIADRGIESYYHELEQINPIAASKIDKRNIRRVIRALEVAHQTASSVSGLPGKKTPDYETLIIGLTSDRDILYKKVDNRVDLMLQSGLVAEVNYLINAGFGFDLPSMNSIGYQQIGMALRNEISMDEASRKIKTNTHRFIRHQYAWFHLTDPRIRWFDIKSDLFAEVSRAIEQFL